MSLKGGEGRERPYLEGLGRAIEVSWDRRDPSQVAEAERKFNEYTRQGWLAFTLTPEGGKAQVYSFDPSMDKVFLIPLAEGG